jgi:hypothetical protein
VGVGIVMVIRLVIGFVELVRVTLKRRGVRKSGGWVEEKGWGLLGL